MDPDIYILHVVPPGKLKSQKSTVVHLSPKYNRLNPPGFFSIGRKPNNSNNSYNAPTEMCPAAKDDAPANFIERIWQQRTKENPKLYNGTKFRVHFIGECEEDKEKVLMCLGVTDYKDYLGTNWADNVHELHAQGLAIHNNSQAFLSDALGVGAFLLTEDECVVFLRRSEFCAEAPCSWDIPGGHAEPNEIVGEIPIDQINVEEMKEELVTAEIFQSIIREVTDEVNIAPTHLEEPLYMGTARNKTSGGRPSSEFLIRCHLASQEVKRLYENGNQLEADESTNIKIIPLHDINQMAKKSIRDSSDLWKSLAPSAKGCLILYWMSHQI